MQAKAAGDIVALYPKKVRICFTFLLLYTLDNTPMSFYHHFIPHSLQLFSARLYSIKLCQVIMIMSYNFGIIFLSLGHQPPNTGESLIRTSADAQLRVMDGQELVENTAEAVVDRLRSLFDKERKVWQR